MIKDPDLKIEVADIVGLYLHRKQHAAVFCLGDTSWMPSLDDLSAVRRTLGGMTYWPPNRHCSGTECLYEAFSEGSSNVLRRSASADASIEFGTFLAEVVDNLPPGREFHVIADNPDAHRHLQVESLLGARSTVYLHFTSTYSSWLNQVEFYLACIERDLTRYRTTVPVRSLKRGLIEQIRRFEIAPEAVNWRHVDPAQFVTTQQ
jgi:hypothetical protein